MAEEKRYFWLKLNENFFEQEEIKVIEGMENGEKYVNFYLKLLLKSLSTNGKLLFRNIIPYTPEMLSTITNTNIDTVRVATKLFVNLGLMEKLDDGSLFMSEVENMVGSETGWAKKKRLQRGKKDNVPKLSKKCPTELELELELELDKELDKDKENIEKKSDKPTTHKNFIPPTAEEIKAYCTERKNRVDAERFYDFYTAKGWVIGKNKMKDWKAAVRTWERNDNRVRTDSSRDNGAHTRKREEKVPKYGEVL